MAKRSIPSDDGISIVRRDCAGVLALGFVMLLTVTGGCARERPGQRIVLITLDTLRYDSLVSDAGHPSTMPLLAQWADQAARFEHFYSATAATQPSHASMFTGLHPWQHGVTGNRLRLAESHVTLAERLNEAGYATAAVVASLPVSERFGFGQGFDQFDDEFVLGMVTEAAGLEQPEEAFYSLADVITERALAQLQSAERRRQFFWFHYFDPHSPYGDTGEGPTIEPREVLDLALAGQETDEMVRRARQLYDLDVGSLDEALSRLLNTLNQDAEDFETHIVITADHGESFGEDGSIAHGRRLIPSQLHVPCLIRSPRVAAGRRSDVAGSIDIATTILALAGVEEMPERAQQLKSRDLTQPAPASGSQAFGMRRTWDKPHRDIRLDGTVHLLDEHLFFAVEGEGRLYRGNGEQLLESDAAILPSEKAQNLKRLFASFEQLLGNNTAAGVDDPETIKALRALGYVG